MSVIGALILVVGLSVVFYVALAPILWARREAAGTGGKAKDEPYGSGGYFSWNAGGGGGGSYCGGDGGGGCAGGGGDGGG